MTVESAPGAVTFNPFDPAFRADPYPNFRRLREEDPYHVSPIGATVLSRYDDCARVLRDPRSSSDERNSTMYQQLVESGGFQTSAAVQDVMEAKPFLFRDPPDHTRMRGLVSKAFTPKMVERLRPRVQELVDDLLDRAADQGSFELIEDLAYPLPVTVISDMMGVPEGDRDAFKGWSRALARGLDPDFILPPEDVQRRDQAILEFRDWFDELVAARRKAPGDDLLSGLIAAEEAGDRLTHAELLTTAILLLTAGHETTVNLIGNGALALLRNRDQLERLAADRGLARSAVEEVLRYDPPVQMTIRVALEDMDVGAVNIPKGGQAVILIGSANRDPDQFPDPDRFDIGRGDSRHLAFGSGPHFCLGAPLARLEGQVALAGLAQRLPSLELAVDDPPYKDNLVLRGLASLPVTW